MNDGVFLHLLDGSAVEEPQGVQDFSDELARDLKERIIGVKYKVSLTFTGDGAKYLDDKYQAGGFCGTVAYEARQWCNGSEFTVIRGEINLAECKFNETECEVEAGIADDGIGARIINNKDIPVSPTAEVTKNTLPITPIAALSIRMFTPSTGAFGAARYCFDWFDCLKNTVLYITDNEVSVVSSWYSSLPDGEQYLLASGYEMRTATGLPSAPLVYSFKALFDEIGKKHNLWIGVERDALGSPVLRVEPEPYFYGTGGTIQHADIQDLIRSTDLDRLYAKVSVGSDTFIKEQGGAFSLPFLTLRGFTKEEFHFEGTCNTDESLDLVNKWVIDSNVIEDVVVNGNDEYDDDMFIVQYTPSTNRATQGTYLTPGSAPYLYNEQLQSSLVIARYDLPSPVGAFFNATSAAFRAERTSPNPVEFYPLPAGLSTLAIVQYDDDYTPPNNDTSNAWGNGTTQGNPVSQADSRYTAAAQGYFEFDVSMLWRITQNVPLVLGSGINQRAYKSIRPDIQVEHYTAANVLIGTPQGIPASAFQYVAGAYSISGTIGVSMDVGEYIQVRYQFEHTAPTVQTPFAGPLPPLFPEGVTVRLLNGSVIKTSFVTGGGYVAGGGQARIIKYEYERDVDIATWSNLVADPKQQIAIGGGPQALLTTHLLNAERNIVTGATTWSVIKRP